MTTTYAITIEMSQSTVSALARNGYALCVFNAVQTTARDAEPLLWVRYEGYQTQTKVSWQDLYQAYSSTSHISSGSAVRLTDFRGVTLGQTADIGSDGHVTVSGSGTATAISIQNNTTETWTTGVSQVGVEGFMPVCAFSLRADDLQTATPLKQVLLMFTLAPLKESAPAYNTGAATAVLIDMTDAATRTVSYDTNGGWSWDGGSWAQAVPMQTDLGPLLIVS